MGQKSTQSMMPTGPSWRRTRIPPSEGQSGWPAYFWDLPRLSKGTSGCCAYLFVQPTCPSGSAPLALAMTLGSRQRIRRVLVTHHLFALLRMTSTTMHLSCKPRTSRPRPTCCFSSNRSLSRGIPAKLVTTRNSVDAVASAQQSRRLSTVYGASKAADKTRGH